MSGKQVDECRALLLVTRNFPPAVGGLERYAEDLYRSLAENTPVVLLANRSGRSGVPLFLFKVLWHVLRHRHSYWHAHFADAALAPLACLVRWLTGTTVSATTHALDVIHPNPIYRHIVPHCLGSLDGVVCVSRFTRDACVVRGVDSDRCRVIPNGIRYEEPEMSPGPSGDIAGLPCNTAGKTVLLTIGRLVKRKGVAWFTAEVMPRLEENYLYLIGGAGAERAAIERHVVEHGLQDRVALLGTIDEQQKQVLLARADLFVMPNVSIPGDAEGFGIVVIEATARGVPVVATGIEGLRDAVIDGVTGTLVPERDVTAWLDAIRTADFDRRLVADTTRERFSWSRLVTAYVEFFGGLERR